MTRPISNLDIELLENIIAVALDGDDLCKLLAQHLDRRRQLEILKSIQDTFNRIRSISIEHRQKNRAGVIARPIATRKVAPYDPTIIPENSQS